jgi:DNA-binding NarL/FixJ family response regulator
MIETRPVRVLIADDQALFRGGLSRLLRDDPRVDVVGEAVDGEDACKQAVALKPDVILMDLKMPNLDGMQATQRILLNDPTAKVLVLTTFDTDGYVLQALRAGASGYVLKDSSSEDLVKAFEKVRAGSPYLSGDMAMQVALVRTGARTDPLAGLTPRECMILGTAAYMSPEQARGKTVDKRADIWAFGVVLYELLAGCMLFGGGETVTDSIAAVLTREPDWNALPAETPPRVLRLMERCLRKDPKMRTRDIGEARLVLDDVEPELTPQQRAFHEPVERFDQDTRPRWP